MSKEKKLNVGWRYEDYIHMALKYNEPLDEFHWIKCTDNLYRVFRKGIILEIFNEEKDVVKYCKDLVRKLNNGEFNFSE